MKRREWLSGIVYVKKVYSETSGRGIFRIAEFMEESFIRSHMRENAEINLQLS
jgi:hypothetical protein